MILIDGKKIGIDLKQEIAEEVVFLKKLTGKTPHLAAVLVGNDGGSEAYVANKVKACSEVGFNSTLIRLPTEVTELQLLSEVEKLNKNKDIDGFIVQLPLPEQVNESKIIEAILPEKDVDGFHPINVGRMVLSLPGFLPATPYGIVELLNRYHIETSGKHCVVVGRSNIVGTPLSLLLSRNVQLGNSTVTITHSRTEHLKEITLQADILIAAIGKPGFITRDMVKEHAVVIDVGTTRIPDSSKKSGVRLVGDVDFNNVKEVCSYITPVPGGVGPMTIVSLLRNTLKAFKNKNRL
jgi:methylenetetrahydrofolate dehydrogenase (NADP+) / methenyltetrahydrofolate cyclohydrolase